MTVKTGIIVLDELLGGGVGDKSSILIRGFKGSGRSSVCARFILEGLRNKENCLYVTSENAPKVVLDKNKELKKYSDALEFITVKKRNKSLLVDIRKKIVDKKLTRVVIDSANVLINAKNYKKTTHDVQEILSALSGTTRIITLNTDRLNNIVVNVCSDLFDTVLELSNEADGHYCNIINSTKKDLVGKAFNMDESATLKEVREFFQ